MSTYIKINGTEYPAQISGAIYDRAWGDRNSKSITLEMSHATAAELFVDGAAWSIVQRELYPVYEAGQPTGETQEVVEEFDNSEYSVAGSITDNRNGTITAKMGKPTELEETKAQLADAELAAQILLGEAE